jgi:hypothetical protein
MPIVVELVSPSGAVRRQLSDPSGGTFDAAGDFDRFLDDGLGSVRDMPLPTLRRFDPIGVSELQAEDMPALLVDVNLCLQVARAGSERRGLLRLAVLAEACAKETGSRLVCIGD